MSNSLLLSSMRVLACVWSTRTSCAGIIKGSRLVSGCMHRFCTQCIEKWLRMTKCGLPACWICVAIQALWFLSSHGYDYWRYARLCL